MVNPAGTCAARDAGIKRLPDSANGFCPMDKFDSVLNEAVKYRKLPRVKRGSRWLNVFTFDVCSPQKSESLSVLAKALTNTHRYLLPKSFPPFFRRTRRLQNGLGYFRRRIAQRCPFTDV